MSFPTLITERLILRDWRSEDLVPFSRLNADPCVMKYFRRSLTCEESNDFVAVARKQLAERGFGWWAVEIKETSEFIGFVGLSVANFPAHFTPCVETGWRIAFDHWGKGYATEAAEAALARAYGVLGFDEVVAFTAVLNERSRRVMERLGMKRSPMDDFDYPAIPEGHPLRRHVLYRLSRRDPGATRFVQKKEKSD